MNYQHDPGCRYAAFGMPHTDAAKRVSDTYNLHLEAGKSFGNSNVGKVIALALSDGRSDGTVYDSMYDAVRHQHHNEDYYAFAKINPSSMSPCDAESFLKMERLRYDAQMKLADRDHKKGGYALIPRLNAEDQARQEEILRTGKGSLALGYLD